MTVFRLLRTLVVVLPLVGLLFVQCDSAEVSTLGESTVYAFQNHHPDTKYIGMAECATCHIDKYKTFRHTGKGRSFHAPDTASRVEDQHQPPVYDRFGDVYYQPFWKNNDLFIREFRLLSGDTVHNRVEKVSYVIGSGNQTRSYIREVNGYLYEMPITWYVAKKLWDLSPGYENGLNSRFDRPVGDQCMSCHTSGVQFEAHSVNRFKAFSDGIECERCHGPGEHHIRAVQEQKDLSGTIVNPAKLSTELRFDVCRQCHLEGVVVEKAQKSIHGFRPGMKLSDFYDVFIPVEQDVKEFGFASHAERLQLSACFKGMQGQMACTHCHDPHQAIQTNSRTYFNEKCLSCHAQNGCSEEHHAMAEMENDCVQCHMQKGGTEDIPHVSSTDHLIRILRQEPSTEQAHVSSSELKQFKSFTSDHLDDRTNVLLHMNYYEQFDGNKGYLTRVRHLVGQLKPIEQVRFAYLLGEGHEPLDLTAFKTDQITDPYACYHLYTVWERKGASHPEWLERAVQLAPQNQDFLFQLATVHDQSGRADAAELYERLLQLNPTHAQALVNYGYYLKERKKLSEATVLLERACALYPDYQLAFENLTACYIDGNTFDKAQKLLERMVKQFPDQPRYKELLNRISRF